MLSHIKDFYGARIILKMIISFTEENRTRMSKLLKLLMDWILL